MATETVTIQAPNMKEVAVRIRGTAPFVQNRFGESAILQMREKHAAGEAKPTERKKRQPKDFERLYRESMYEGKGGERGIPASGVRAAMIGACRLIGQKMTLAKLVFFVRTDVQDKRDGTPLVAITKGEPRSFESCPPNANGQPDIRVRAMWDTGWEAVVRIAYDADMFSADSAVNLLAHAGRVGLGAGRPGSVNSGGCGWGTFEVVAGDNTEQEVSATRKTGKTRTQRGLPTTV